MTQAPAGWHPDPWLPGTPGALRYWNGHAWTADTAYRPLPAAYQIPPKAVPTTPDGQPLSGWWRRVAAQLIDGFILAPIMVALAIPVVASHWGELTDWFDASIDAAGSGGPRPPKPALLDPFSGPQLTLALLNLVVVGSYTLGFWRWKQATPGKLAVGIRIRRRDLPGPMPWGTMLTRFGFVEALSLAGSLPIIGVVLSFAILLDYLWPLWDEKNQALHDKVAGTNVVLAPRKDVPTADLAARGLPPRW